MLDFLKREYQYLFLIIWMIFLENHGRLCLLSNDALGMHLCMMSRKVFAPVVPGSTRIIVNKLKDVRGTKVGE